MTPVVHRKSPDLYLKKGYSEGTVLVFDDSEQEVGSVEVSIEAGNVVVTVYRADEARFGPAYLVVV